MDQLFKIFPVFTVEKGITLREFKHSDSSTYMQLLKHPQVAPFVPEGCIPKRSADAIKYVFYLQSLFKQKKRFVWAISNENDHLIGSCGFENWNQFHRRAEISYELHPDSWGQGIMHRSLKKIIDFAFTKMNVVRLEAYTRDDNPQSTRVLDRLDFSFEGRLVKHRFFNGSHIDVLVYGRIK